MRTMQLIVSSPAKLNLSFDIIGRDQNGYHQLVTLFQAIDFNDRLTFEIAPANQNSVHLFLKAANAQSTALPLDDNNLISKAVKLFLARLFEPPVQIAVTIEKNIPIGAGLAGGSSNAAATLLVLSNYFNRPFTEANLMEMASELGSDVAFCLGGGLAAGQGYGEKLQRLPLSLRAHFVLVKPKSISISTAWAYSTFDQAVDFSYTGEQEAKTKLNDLINQLKNKALYSIPRPAQMSELFWNSFEPVIFKEFPVLSEIKEHLLKLGCLEAHLTGSGPTIYGLVRNAEHGQEVLKNILATELNHNSESQQAIILEGWLVKSIDHGVKVEEAYEAKQQTTARS